MASFNGSSALANWTLSQIDLSQDCDHAINIFRWPYETKLVIDAIRRLAPDPFLHLSDGVVVDWVNSLEDSDDHAAAISAIYTNCAAEFCQYLAWSGNPDLAGVGVFVSYLVEIGLASIFAVVIASERVFGVVIKPARLHHAFRTSFGLFWDSALLFNLAVTISAIVSLSTDPDAYDVEFTRLSLSITWSVTAATWVLYLPICRHRMARWLGVWASSVTYAAMMFTQWRSRRRGPFVYYCIEEVYSTPALVAATTMSEIVLYITGWLATGFGFIFLIYGLYVICRWVVTRIAKSSRVSGSSQTPKRRRGKKFRRFITGCTTLSSVVLFSLLYISLAVIGIKRATTTKAAGPALEQDQWTFGQVMAMATWVPTFLDFVLVVRGSLTALEYRLPIGVGVRIFPEETDTPPSEGQPMVAVEEANNGTGYKPVFQEATTANVSG